MPIPPGDVLQKIIAQGDAEVLVDWAEKIGKAILEKVTIVGGTVVTGSETE